MARSEIELNEWSVVEKPLIDQLLAAAGRGSWAFLEGSTSSLAGQGRGSWRDVLLKDRLSAALRRINLNPKGDEWLDDDRINTAMKDLETLRAATGQGLMERNQAATKLLLEGTTVTGVPGWDHGRDRRVRFIDWTHPERNEFLVINQFRVDEPVGQQHTYILPDLVLFINGIPVAVIECKSPAATNPIEEAVNQLLRYSNQRHWIDANEGNEKLFHYCQLMVATDFDDARISTPGGQFEHYLPWKDCYPTLLGDLAEGLGRTKASPQQVLAEGVLKPERLLDIIQHFTLFMAVDGRTVKIAPRYQQYRAVLKAVERLENGRTRAEDGEFDRRGGIIFHTQGSGKSLTMVFLVRRMRSSDKLASFKVVFITDRIDLQTQLSETAELTGDPLYMVDKVKNLAKHIKAQGPSIIFAMVQKYQEDQKARKKGEKPKPLGELNASEKILIIADEAHRSHAKSLHANLTAAMPNAAKIGFTGTPIIIGKKKRTHAIFGEFIDRYTIVQAQDDEAIVPILYEFRDAKGEIKDGKTVDQIFEEVFKHNTLREREAIQQKYATASKVLEGKELIKAKALDMMRHYISVVLPSGFKAQITAISRKAVLRYYDALKAARDHWLAEINQLAPEWQDASEEAIEKLEQGDDQDLIFLVKAWKHRDLIAKLEFAPVISGRHNDDPAYAKWTDKHKIEQRTQRFKKPFHHKDPEKRDNLAFLIVKSMLLVGFDAPVEQVLYIDRKLKEDELLQAIARVNRTRSGKNIGYVVDYANVGGELAIALAAYTEDDIQGAFRSAGQELIDLRDRYNRVLQVFSDLRVKSIHDTEACVEALRPERERARFIVAYKRFLKTFSNLEHRPEARKYARDAKALGFINIRARNRYRDDQLNIMGVGDKVSRMIDDYVRSNGVEPSIPPIDLLDADFKDQVDKLKSARAAASEMEHAARYHISKKYKEDPEHYEKLSQRLKSILERFGDDADALKKALRDFIEVIQQGRQEDDTGLDPETQAPFYGVLGPSYEKRYGKLTEEKRLKLIELTVELVEIIRQEIGRVNFWGDRTKQDILRSLLIDRLDHPEISNHLDFIEPLTDELMEVAKHNHARLTSHA